MLDLFSKCCPFIKEITAARNSRLKSRPKKFTHSFSIFNLSFQEFLLKHALSDLHVKSEWVWSRLPSSAGCRVALYLWGSIHTSLSILLFPSFSAQETNSGKRRELRLRLHILGTDFIICECVSTDGKKIDTKSNFERFFLEMHDSVGVWDTWSPNQSHAHVIARVHL